MTLQIHLRMIRKEGFALGNSSCLKIQGFERNLSHYFLFFIIINLLQLWQFLAADLLYFLGEGRAGGTEMAQFPAAEAKFLFNAAFAFFQGKLGDFDGIYNHGIRVMGFSGRGVGEGVVRLMGVF